MCSKENLFRAHDSSIINRIVPEMKITDIHTHGFGGYDTRTTTVENILKIAEIHGAFGVSQIILTVYPSSVPEMRGHMDTIRKAIKIQQSSLRGHQLRQEERAAADKRQNTDVTPDGLGQAMIAGLHLEGPFLNPKRSGALDTEACMKPAEYSLKELTEGFENIIKIITIAPEMPGALNLIRKLSDMGIVVSMGHSDATYAEAEAGFHAGARGITHIFNAMGSFHHREPGISGFGLLNDNIYI
jgi:N-acetylglucosamine-6-phosphate deacetylase